MDSLTQIVLGAAVGEVVLGKKIGNHAMLWGAIAGTIPDLDVFFNFVTDPITASELHRGFSHSLIFSILFAPIFGWLVHKLYKKREDVSFTNWSWLFFWTLVTHPLLDNHTSWGTQFFWPLEYRVAFKNIFVIDPFYTLPFLFFIILALFHKKSNPRRSKLNKIGLIISSIYMLLTITFKGIGYYKFSNALENQSIDFSEMDTRPMPLNSILWNAQIETKDGFRMGYYSIFDTKGITFSEEIPKNHFLLKPYLDQKVIKQLIKISDGWYFVRKEEHDLYFFDLRFGQLGTKEDSPYVWKYKLTVDENGKISAEKAEIKMDKEKIYKALNELKDRALGN